jgi:hypothetical protein
MSSTTPTPRLRRTRYFVAATMSPLEDALLKLGLEAELLVDLVATDAAEIVALRIEEETLEESLRVGGGRRLAGRRRL